MKEILNDIREKTEGMSRQDKVSYILTYYWYHMLIIFSVLALIVIFIVHYATYKKSEFTCVMVNQQIDTQRDNQMTEEFAKFSKMDPKRIEINSNYNFSYGDLKLADVNESSNEKFFLQWRNNELDTVIMTESFYEYCKEVGGEFRDLDAWGIDTGTYEKYQDHGKTTGIVLGTDQMTEKVTGTGEKLLLVFPSNGKHEKASKMYLKYIIGGNADEEISNR